MAQRQAVHPRVRGGPPAIDIYHSEAAGPPSSLNLSLPIHSRVSSGGMDPEPTVNYTTLEVPMAVAVETTDGTVPPMVTTFPASSVGNNAAELQPMQEVEAIAKPRRGRAPGLKVPRWTMEEDERLKALVQEHGNKAWDTIAGCFEILRSGTAIEQHYNILIGKRKKPGHPKDAVPLLGDAPPLPEGLDDETRVLRAAEAVEQAAQKAEERAIRQEEKAAVDAAKDARRLEKQAARERDAADKEEKRQAREAKRQERAEKAAQPKKARSSYLFYSEETRPLLKVQHPELGVMDIAKLQGEGWKGLTEAERQKYVRAAEEDKLRYVREMEAAGLPVTSASHAAKKARVEGDLPAVKVPKQKQSGASRRAEQKKGSPSKPLLEKDDDDEKDDDEEEEVFEVIEWYLPEGYVVQSDPPSAAQLEFGNEEGDALVGRHILYNWEGVGWCEGMIEERNTIPKIRLGGVTVNFWVYYPLDENLSRHVLDVDSYQWGAGAEWDSFVLLSKADNHAIVGEEGEEAELDQVGEAAAEESDEVQSGEELSPAIAVDMY